MVPTCRMKAQVNTTWSCEPHSTVQNLWIWEVHICKSSESLEVSRSLPPEVLQALETERNPVAHPEHTGKSTWWHLRVTKEKLVFDINCGRHWWWMIKLSPTVQQQSNQRQRYITKHKVHRTGTEFVFLLLLIKGISFNPDFVCKIYVKHINLNQSASLHCYVIWISSMLSVLAI